MGHPDLVAFLGWGEFDVVEGGGVGALGGAFDGDYVAGVELDGGDGFAGGVVGVWAGCGEVGIGGPGGDGGSVDEEGEFGSAVGEVEISDGDVVVAGDAGEGPFSGAMGGRRG